MLLPLMGVIGISFSPKIPPKIHFLLFLILLTKITGS